MEEEKEPLFVVGLPLDVNLINLNIHRAMNHHHEKSSAATCLALVVDRWNLGLK